MEHIQSFKVIGISVETTNENAKSAKDLKELWEKFFNENIAEKIIDKTDHKIYSIYTEYDNDYNGKYTSIIGYEVNSLDNIPEGLSGYEIPGGTYRKFTAKGEIPGAVVNTWKEIWAKDRELKRKYTADFEVYGEKSQNGENSEVDIYIAIDQ